MEGSPLRRVVAGGMLLAIPLGLLGFLFLIQSEFREIRQLRQSFATSIETRSDFAQVLVQHLNVESGQRGYVVTGQRRFLEPYLAGRNRIGGLLERLDRSVGGDPELAAVVTRIERLSDAKLAFAQTTVDLAASGDMAAARALVAQGRGKVVMDAIRHEVMLADQIERERLASITRSGDASRQRVENRIYLLLSAFALLLALVAIVTFRAMRDRQSAFARANELADRQRAILNGAVDGLLLLDEDGYIRDLNPSITRQFGFDAAHLIGKHNTYLMATPPPLPVSIAWIRQVGAAGLSGAGDRSEFTGQRADGTIFETDVAISRVAEQGDARFVAIIRDITERKRIEGMKTEFVSTVSHELRTPLTSISGSLGLLASGAVGDLGAKAARLVEIAHHNCERLIRLINDILDIEKIESGKMHYDMRRLEIAPLVERVVAANTAFAEAHDIALVAHIGDEALCIRGDDDRLDQLLTNLLSNAIKHAPKGSEVEIYIGRKNGQAQIEVCDRGDGIPAEFRARIFEKFAMADSADNRARGGTGLGLSISREIVNRHGGSIAFADRAGGGTSFTVEFPLLAASMEGSDEEADDAPRLLHLDDDRDCLAVVASAFEGKAHVTSVTSLAAAREAIAATRFDAAIIDVSVTPDSGLDLVPHLREAQPLVPIVLFTAFDALYSEDKVDAILVKSRRSVSDLVGVTLRLAANAAEASE